MANDSTPNTAAANTPTGEPTPTAQLRPGGAPARVYMNEKIVPYLLEGMKHVTKEQWVGIPLPDSSSTSVINGQKMELANRGVWWNGIRPQNPLRVLGEFLIQKSNEVEGAKSPE